MTNGIFFFFRSWVAMKTSSPIGSPLRRLNQNLIIEDDFDDLETELQARRQEAINKSTERRRKSTAAPLLAGLTATQLAQHCKDCIKLSTENKINSKNAFSFMLIDVMAVMAKKNDSEINNNFQVASCTLDASVKIYGYRVDAVHTEAIKMAGGILAKEIDVDETGSKEDWKKDDRGDSNVKKKKKKRKLTVVNPKTLNAKSEPEVLLDIVPRPNFLAMKTNGNDLLIRIPKYNDAGSLLIDSDYPSWPYDKSKSVAPTFRNEESFDLENLVLILKNTLASNDDKLCRHYTEYEFGKDNEEEDSENEFSMSQNSNRFEFDVNSTLQDVPISEDEGEVKQGNRLDIPMGGYESGEEILPNEPHQKKTQKAALADMKNRISINPLEYSMFDEKIFKSWAGPTYWKVKPIGKKQREDDKQDEDVSKQVASKRTRKGKAKGPVGLLEVSEGVLVKHLALSKSSTLRKSTMLNWSYVNTTCPKDCKYKAKNLFTLFYVPTMVIETKAEVDDEGELLDDTDEKRDDDDPAEEELEYCSSLIIRDEGDDFNNEDENFDVPEQRPDSGINGQGDAEPWDHGNMVAVPNQVEKIAVSSFKRKKHVDIKQLKKCIWNILTESNVFENAQEKIARTIEFSRLIKMYLNKVPKNLSSSLSAPMIFNALLHLSNEKSLVLKQDITNKADFVVSL